MKYSYEVFYQKKRMTITNYGGTYNAQQEAATIWKVPAKKRYLIHVVLAAKDGVPVVHSGAEL